MLFHIKFHSLFCTLIFLLYFYWSDMFLAVSLKVLFVEIKRLSIKVLPFLDRDGLRASVNMSLNLKRPAALINLKQSSQCLTSTDQSMLIHMVLFSPLLVESKFIFSNAAEFWLSTYTSYKLCDL